MKNNKNITKSPNPGEKFIYHNLRKKTKQQQLTNIKQITKKKMNKSHILLITSDYHSGEGNHRGRITR